VFDLRETRALLAEQRLKVPAAANDADNHHLVVLDPIDDDVLSCGEAPQARAQVFVARTARYGFRDRRKNRSVMESIRWSALAMLPLLLAL
jgi:hypothetical protein